MKELLKITDLKLNYGMISAIKGIDLSVGEGQIVAILGANGAGVTSILVKAIDNHNFWLKARHVLEVPFIFAARKRRI